MQVIGALIKGDQSTALLSESALISALDILSSYLPSDCSTEEDRDIETEFSVLFALDAVLFSQTVLLDKDQKSLRPAAVRALVALFQIAWVFGGPEPAPSSDAGNHCPTEIEGHAVHTQMPLQ